jgi:hypothetical protein
MTLLVRAPDNLLAERRYILDVVLSEWLGFEYELALEARSDIAVRLLGDPQERELKLADVLFATPPEDWLSERSMPVSPLPRLAADVAGVPSPGKSGIPKSTTPLPILFGKPDQDGQFLWRTPNEISLMVDIFGSVFYLLTRYEEVVVPGRDTHERFPASASLASAEGFLDRPVVEEYVDLLWQAMRSLWPGLSRLETSFRLRLTHDVDRPWAVFGRNLESVTHAVGGDLVHRRDPALAARRIRSLLDARSGRVDRDPFNTFGLLMDTSERYGLQSTFYFMTGATNPRFDGSYRISDPPVMRLLKQINERGHEVGLHASYDTFRSLDQTRAEFDSLRATCRTLGFDQSMWGVRQHYLRFEVPVTWRNQGAAGLAYDSTLGFADVNGFRAGTCREYPVFDLLGHTRLELRERPLIVMDAASDEYLAMDFTGAAAGVQALVAECRRHDGDAVLLYHNSSLPGSTQRAHYRELIESLVHPG